MKKAKLKAAVAALEQDVAVLRGHLETRTAERNAAQDEAAEAKARASATDHTLAVHQAAGRRVGRVLGFAAALLKGVGARVVAGQRLRVVMPAVFDDTREYPTLDALEQELFLAVMGPPVSAGEAGLEPPAELPTGLEACNAPGDKVCRNPGVMAPCEAGTCPACDAMRGVKTKVVA